MGQNEIGEFITRYKLEAIVKHKSDYSVDHPNRGTGEVAYVHVVRIGKYLLQFSPDNFRILAFVLNQDGEYIPLKEKLIDFIKRTTYVPKTVVIEDWKNPNAVTIDVIVGLQEEMDLIEKALA